MKFNLEFRKKLYTGQWKIESERGKNWIFYFRLGRLNGCEANSLDPLFRYLEKHCLEQHQELIQQNLKTTQDQCKILENLHERQSIDKETLSTIIRGMAQEFLFDIVQVEQTEALQQSQPSKEIPNLPPLTEIDPILQAAEENWQAWCHANLAQYSPNSYPIIQAESSLTQDLITLIEGRHTLRELAWKTDQTLLDLMLRLVPFLESGAIELSQTKVTQTAVKKQEEPRDRQLDASLEQPEKTVTLEATVKRFRGSPYIQEAASYYTALNATKQFLEQGNPVKLVVNFQGVNHVDTAFANQAFHRLAENLQNEAEVKQISELDHCQMILKLSPYPRS